MLRQTFSSLLLVTSFLLGNAHAADVSPCSTIRYEPNRVYTVRARLNHATHIILPEPMNGKPVTGNPELWAVDGQSTHLFIKPTTADAADGAGTTVTVVGTSNTSYDLEVKRVATGGDLCVRITKDGTLISSDTDWKTLEERRVSTLNSQVTTLQEQLATVSKDQDKRALGAVREYQSRIYTQYEWSKGKGFIGENFISDIWDDGRFTYVRVTQDNKGIMQVSAMVDGKKELIDYDYDSSKRMYTLSGLFPQLTLAYGKSSITVDRANNKTAGL
jgi:type IV secretory pathway VirB9-like protein